MPDMAHVVDYLDAKEPCYILFRQDEKNANGFCWLLCCYVPDASKVKDKMTYASSRSNLKQTLGGGFFSHEVFGTVKVLNSRKSSYLLCDRTTSHSMVSSLTLR